MGEVFRARHLIFGTDFVIKVMKPSLRENAALQKRFIREALFARKVRHPNVASVKDAARLPDDSLFIVADFVAGANLASVIRAAGRLPQSRCRNIAGQMLNGLEAIHGAGLIHRDLSPDNIMISDHDHVTIIDFGIAKQIDGDISLTESHLFLGKMRYASPEQLRADPEAPIDTRSDLYSFGITLYEMLTGEVPFYAPSAGALLSLHFFTPPPPLPPSLGASALLQDVVNRSLAKTRNDRFQSAAELRGALENGFQEVSAASSPEITSTIAVGEIDPSSVLPPPSLTEPHGLRLPVSLYKGVGVIAVAVALILLGIQLTPNTVGRSSINTASTVDVVQTDTSSGPAKTVADTVVTAMPSLASSTEAVKEAEENLPTSTVGTEGTEQNATTSPREPEGTERPKVAPVNADSPTPTVGDVETTFWESVQKRNTASAYDEYLERYPNGTYEVLARRRGAAVVAAGAPAVKTDAEESAYWVDPETRLMWTAKDSGSDVNWTRANTYCKGMTLGNMSGWRLASLDELKSLLHRSIAKNDKIKMQMQLPGNWVWSSTDRNRFFARALFFPDGTSGPQDLSFALRVLCVRNLEK